MHYTPNRDMGLRQQTDAFGANAHLPRRHRSAQPSRATLFRARKETEHIRFFQRTQDLNILFRQPQIAKAGPNTAAEIKN